MPKHCFWECFWRNLKVSQFFHFFVFFASFDHPGCTGQKFLPKKLPRSMLKTCLIAFGNVFSGILNRWKFFQFFEVFPSFDAPGCTGQEKIEKITSSKFGHFLKRFSGFWNFEFFDFCRFFLSLQGSLGTAFSVEKINQNILMQCFWEIFRTILKTSKFFFFLKFFPSLDPPGCTGDFFSKKNYFKTGSENVWTILGTTLDTLEILKFSIFSKSFPYSTLQDALGTNFTETITSKQVQNMFDCFWERFLSILKNWKFFQFFGVFPSFDSAGCTGHVFPKKSPQNNFKTCLNTFRNVFGHFSNFKFFSIFFSNFSKFRPSRVHWSNFFTEKTTSKHNQNLFELFGEHFWAFWKKNESFSIFVMFFHVSTLQGALGDIFFRKIPQNKFKTCLETFKNVFGHF